MNHSAPPSPSPYKNRRSDIYFIVITVILSLCLAANLILIFCMSAENSTASGNRSDGITDAVVDVVYPNIQQRPSDEQTGVFISMQRLVRKLAHFSEFALLGFFTLLLVRHLAHRLTALRLWTQWTIPLVFGLLYAISDEVHQIFTDRGPRVTDVLIDFAGVLTGVLLAWATAWVCGRIRHAVRTARNEKVSTA